MKKLCRKIKDRCGDSFVEVLCALLIICFSFAALCNAIVTAKKVNKKVRDVDIPFAYSTDAAVTAIKGTVVINVSPAGIITGGAVANLTTVGPEGSTYRYYTYEAQ